RAAGVSPSTVSNVYNRPEVVSPQLRERVLQAAGELGYAGADPAARSLRSGRTGAIGVVLRERLAYSFDDPAAVRFLQGVSDAGDPQQLALVILPAYPEQAGAYGPAIGRAAVDGLLLYSLVADDPLVEASLQRRLPTVVIDSPAPGDMPLTDGCGFVGIDEHAAAQAAVGHLMELGHRRLGVLSLRLSAGSHPGPADLTAQAAATASVARGRLEGARRASEAAGLDWTAVPVEQCRVSDVAGGRAGAHALLDRAPGTTAIFALSDPLALGARLAARERGLSVPGDLSIAGFDDSASEADGLTTVHQPLREKGVAATELLLRMLAGEERSRTLLPTRLVVRGSTAPLAL
ncbi:MAG TPA: LacI family DNA-binding transcriptional regulator, partial [Solirubrobacteraceae bacterium]|nr:LacI family DNA-binding transcriptional regulator [Solirubrobacteraceae bacterium]